MVDWETLYEGHLNLAISNLRYGLRYGRMWEIESSWIYFKAAVRCAWYQING